MSNTVSKDASPSAAFSPIVPGDAELAQPTRALYIGVAGNVVVTPLGAPTDVTFVGVQAGSILPVQVTRVRPATTAGSIVGLY